MKINVALFLLLFSSMSFANTAVDAHWTLTDISCSSGAGAYPGMTPGVRYDLHLFADLRFEEIITRPTDWTIARGDYTKSNNQLCQNTKELINSKGDFENFASSLCTDYRETDSELFLQFKSTGQGEDCPKGDVVTIKFYRM